jgi:DNA-binding transcriptional LysR family regulator
MLNGKFAKQLCEKRTKPMSSDRMDWDDLRFVLAVGRERTLSAAARSLGVNHTTVFRRIGQIETGLGVRLFERHRDGYTPTAAGEEAVALGERLEGQIDGLERQLCGRDTRPSGTLRVTTTDTLLMGALGAPLAAFCRDHPAIALEVTAANPLASLSKRDADLAIRPAAAPPETLVGRRLCVIASAVYGAAAYLEHAPAPEDLGAHPWIAPDDSLAHLASARWLRATLPAVQPALRVNTLLGMAAAARAGGAAVFSRGHRARAEKARAAARWARERAVAADPSRPAPRRTGARVHGFHGPDAAPDAAPVRGRPCRSRDQGLKKLLTARSRPRKGASSAPPLP